MQEFHVCYSLAYEVLTAYTKWNVTVPAAVRRPECLAVPDECVCGLSFQINSVIHADYSCKSPTWHTILFFYMFISILYMFRATSWISSGESVVSIQHLVCVTLCSWPFSMQVGKILPDLHTRRSHRQNDTYQMLYWYNWFSWWWARDCSKHVENWNKHIEKRIVRQVVHLRELYRDARSTEHKTCRLILFFEDLMPLT
jgi:hypothetical protein